MIKQGYALRIKQRIIELEAMVSSAQAELDELRIAERVLGRLSAVSEEKGPDDGKIGTSTTKGGTVGDMAVQALQLNGPLDSGALLLILQQTWRPDLKQTTLGSTLSRIKSEGRVDAENGKWFAKEKTEPPEGGSVKIVPEEFLRDDDDASDPFA
jgi:hypothetical protein